MTEANLNQFLTAFHFMRPAWLALLPLALLLYLTLRSRHSAAEIWRGVIASHLLPHLTVNRGSGSRLEPRTTLSLLLALSALALAGPAWQREAPPFVEERAPLVIVLDLGRTMNAVDTQPTRLTRAKQKIRDLLALRQGARTALIVFAGSTHIVLPLTDDSKILASYVDVLSSDIMPRDGKRMDQALTLAMHLLSKENVAGSILFLTDGVETSRLAIMQTSIGTGPAHLLPKILIWGMGRDGGGPVRATGNANGFAIQADGSRLIARYDAGALENFATSINASFIPLTLDSGDVAAVQRKVESHLADTDASSSPVRWRDAGYWLLWPIIFLAAMSFRRGWTVRW